MEEKEEREVSGHIAPAVRKQGGMGRRVMLMLYPLFSPHFFQYPGLFQRVFSLQLNLSGNTLTWRPTAILASQVTIRDSPAQ